MPRKPRKNSPKVSERFTERLDQMGSLYKQKDLAKKLGVSERTLRNYQNGTSTPNAKTREKLNSLFRSNKEKVNEEKVSKRKQTRQKKSESKKKSDRKKKLTPHLIPTSKFAQQFDDEYIKDNILQVGGEYVAVTDGSNAQFVSAEDIILSRYGKPKGTKFVEIVGVYTNQYEPEGDLKKGDFQENRFPTLWRITQDVALDEFFDYLRDKFFASSRQVGKIKWIPSHFIGYRLV